MCFKSDDAVTACLAPCTADGIWEHQRHTTTPSEATLCAKNLFKLQKIIV